MSLSQQNSTQKWAVIALYWHNQFEDTWLVMKRAHLSCGNYLLLQSTCYPILPSTSRSTPKARKEKTLNLRPLLAPLLLHSAMKSILLLRADTVWIDSVQSATEQGLANRLGKGELSLSCLQSSESLWWSMPRCLCLLQNVYTLGENISNLGTRAKDFPVE